MLKIVYSPEYGQIVPDADIEDFINGYLAMYNDPKKSADKKLTLIVSSELMVLAFRARVALGEISYTDIEFYFEAIQLEHTETGSIVNPPKGYCDRYQNYVKILTQQRRSNIRSIS